MAVLFSPYLQAVDANGAPLSGAKLFFYRTGTTTEITTYQDSAEATPHTNPVVADASGVFAPIYIAYASNFKTVLKTSADVTVQTVDPANSGLLAFTPASASGPASLVLAEDTDNGSNTVTVQAPSSLSADRTVTLPDFSISAWREVLSADRTYYVRTDGSDSNTGLANNSGGAFLTIQKALDVAGSLDCSIYDLTIAVGDGTYTGAVSFPAMIGSGTFTLQGNTSTPANALISVTSSTAVTGTDCGAWVLDGFKLTTTTSGVHIAAAGRTKLTLKRLDFGASAGAQYIAASLGAQVIMNGSTFSLSGSASYALFSAATGAIIQMFGSTVTFLANITASYFIACSKLAGVDSGSMTFTLGAYSMTGARYRVELNGIIFTSGGGASYFPGSSTGTALTGGQYS